MNKFFLGIGIICVLIVIVLIFKYLKLSINPFMIGAFLVGMGIYAFIIFNIWREKGNG